MFSLIEQLMNVPIPLELRTPCKTISKPRHLMTPEELEAWRVKKRAKNRAYRDNNLEKVRAICRESKRRARAA